LLDLLTDTHRNGSDRGLQLGTEGGVIQADSGGGRLAGGMLGDLCQSQGAFAVSRVQVVGQADTQGQE